MQLYVAAPESTLHRPEQELRGFERVMLEPGEATTVEFALERRAFCLYDTASQAWQAPAGGYEIRIGTSSRDIRARETVEIQSKFAAPAAGSSHASPEALRRPTLASLQDTDAFVGQLGAPIPSIEAARPFHRNSTLGEASETFVGSLIQSAILGGVRSQLGDLASRDPTILPMAESMARESPLRSLVLMSGGRVSWALLDRLIGVLNALSFLPGWRR